MAKHIILIIITLSLILSSCLNPGTSAVISSDQISKMADDLRSLTESKDAHIGIAVIINSKDTIEVNGHREFPMMSVFKFPLALAVAYVTEGSSGTLDTKIAVATDDLKENTYSPMLKRYGKKPLTLSLRELLQWSLQESDNNAADILLKHIGGVNGLNETMLKLSFPADIVVGASEDDMHRDPYLCYRNQSTPLAMATLFDTFQKGKNESAAYSEIAEMLESCRTGLDRLAAPLDNNEAKIGHKTGTGDSLIPGRISAINDCGYIILPDGNSYTIAVFIADSAYSMEETSKIISDISAIVYNCMTVSP